ncbi:temperature sensitive supressor-like [hydrothermal vent metagenome]|uniref:Temperature sensitive supressor-like n=1 Tax=hydrothermal vent metagenome TaxID=652676 RepID=A0A3B0UTE1_9ZZZZ
MLDPHEMDRPEILQILFHPRSGAESPVPARARDIDIAVAPDAVIGCRLFTAAKEAPTILFFHGNGEIVQDYNEIGPLYAGQGLNFLVTDYRGYGWSTGRPSVSALLGDAHILYREFNHWLPGHGYTGKLFIMGRSLGSACAIELAAAYNKDVNGLIIESGFAESMPLAETLGLNLAAMGLTEEDGFNNEQKIASVTKPTFILHGLRDTLIPIWQAEKLHAACGARSKELQVIPGAEHNTMTAVGGILYFQAIKRYIDQVTGENSWRSRRKRFKNEQKN